MERVGLILCYILILSLGISSACNTEASSQDETYFEKIVYRATVIDHRIEVVDGPITLSKCDSRNFHFEIITDETKYYPFFSSYLTVNCSMLFYGLVRENVTVEDTLYDVITLEAYVDDYVLAKTSLIVINSSEYDPYKLVYNVNGTEYVILNYFYFKLFLLIIVVIGILILVLEIREIVIKYRGKMYVHIDEQSNYI